MKLKYFFSLALFMNITTVCISQQSNKIDSLINTLDNYMSTHIPDMNSGVSGYKNKVENKTLIKTTFVYEGESHNASFDLDKTTVKIEKLKVDREAARAYGFKYYYEVSIDGSWFSSNIEDVKIAERIKVLLDEIIQELN